MTTRLPAQNSAKQAAGTDIADNAELEVGSYQVFEILPFRRVAQG